MKDLKSMIHIEYRDEQMQFYQDYIRDTFTAKVKQFRNNQSFSYRKEKNLQMDQSCKAFCDYLLSDNNLWNLAETPADKLTDRINEYQNKFTEFGLPKIARKKTLLYKCAYTLFVEIGYKELDAIRILDSIDVDVCPYCNRIFVKAIKTDKERSDSKKGKKVVRGELDHFYSKELYPFLAVSRYNLIPCCSYCNGVNGKHIDDAIEKKLYSPYLIKEDNSDSRFKVSFPSSKCLSLAKCTEGITVDYVCEEYMEGNKKEFNIEALYNSHKDYAAEIYQLSQMRTKHQYYRFLKNHLTKSGYTVSKDEIGRLLLGAYTSSKDFNKRPLSKFITDIATDLGVIDA